jgi:hypothetical protein
MLFRSIVMVLAAWTLALAAPAHAKRLALTIGNDDYQSIEKLHKARADANAYADALREKGFEVREGYDLTRAKFNAAIANFVAAIQPGDTAVFVYSGHGWSDGTQNYLIGVDAPKQASEDELAGETIPIRNGADGVLDRIEHKGATLRVAIIDACRDNPFTPPLGHRGYAEPRGFAPMSPTPQGTFVVFSASPGQSALDRLSEGDPDRNGVFTRVFVPLLRADASLQDAIKRAQKKVLELARSVDHDQRPAYWDEVVGTACLSTACKPIGASGASDGAPTPAIDATMEPEAGQSACERLVNEKADKDAILAADVDTALHACARAVVDHPAEASLTHLLQVAEEQRAAQRALRSADRGASDAYLVLYPTGRFAEDVKQRWASLTPVPAPIVTPAPSPVSLAEPNTVEPPKPKVDPMEIARVLQVELKRVGCDPVSIDGTWGASSEHALAMFNRAAHTAFDVKSPAAEVVYAVRSRSEPVCSLTCNPRERREGNRCVPILCGSGFRVSGSGACVRERDVVQAGPRAQSINRSNCFIFNGVRMCN